MNSSELELTARRYCALAGIDADQSVGHSPDPNEDGTVYSILIYSPMWRLVATDIKRHLLLSQAIAETMALSQKEQQLQAHSDSITL